jgi:hypothetical protein
MVRLAASVSRSDTEVSFRGGTKQLYGFRPSGVPDGRRRSFSDRVPETSPCHGLARQCGELDPEGDVGNKALLRRIESGARRGRPSPRRIGSVRCRLKSWAASKDPQVRSTSLPEYLGPRRGGQSNANGVGPVTQGCHCGIDVPFLATLPHAFAPSCPSSASSSPRRAECRSACV